MNEKFVIIKGVKYDATTGLPIGGSAAARKTATINGVKSFVQKTQAIKNRAASAASSVKAPVRKIGHNMDIARSKSISHFARHDIKKPVTTSVKKPASETIKHPIVARMENKQKQLKTVSKPVAKTPKQIKEETIAAALAKPAAKPIKKSFSIKGIRLPYAILIGLVLFVIAGYFTYINMPNLAVRVAGAQAGIDARYPDYHPDGYSTDGPVTYADGEVTINFKSNTGNGKFTIKQARSSWDSSAVKNKVSDDSNGSFLTTEVRGRTIYTYNGNASWVNGGVLYSITGNAPLSNDQIVKIATSL